MKKIIYFVAISFLVSCAGTPAVEGTKEKEAELVKYKQELHELTLKISALEKELKEGKEIEFVHVKVSEIKPQLFEHFIEVTGNAEAEQEVNVSAEGSGKIIDILVKEG